MKQIAATIANQINAMIPDTDIPKIEREYQRRAATKRRLVASLRLELPVNPIRRNITRLSMVAGGYDFDQRIGG